MDDDGGFAGGILHFLDRSDLWLHRNLSDLAHAPVLGGILSQSRISARGLLIALVTLVLICTVPPLTEWLQKRCGWVARNFRGDVIPKAYGLAIFACSVPLLLLDAFVFHAAAADRMLWAACITSFATLGLLDDLIGDGRARGLRGHVAALVQRRKITTGLVKAAGGLLTAFAIGIHLHRNEPLQILLVTAVIALCANGLNLLDLRPGRACAAFSVTALLLLVICWRQSSIVFVPGLIYVFVPALVAWTHDADAHVMLGDTGSNLLGASIGLAVCLYCGTAAQIAALIVAIGLHVVAERWSITQIIERYPVLRAIDRLTGVR